MSDAFVLRVDGLSKRYGAGCPACRGRLEQEGLLRNYCRACGTVYAVRDASFDVARGEALGIVGESGSGKSTILKCLYFDEAPTAGAAYLSDFQEGKANIFAVSSQQKRGIRNRLLGKVYQNPLEGLRMDFSCLANVAEKLIAAGGRTVEVMESRVRGLLEYVNIPPARMRDAPASFSGGMQQRVQIAKALSSNPPLLLLDEVTTGLDMSVQARVLDLIRVLRQEMSIAMLLVSHDLGVVRMLADRTLVMLDGRIVEQGLTDQVLEDPQHPYTQELVHAML
jgi:putative phosphonate transport system ATP-binding protein